MVVIGLVGLDGSGKDEMAAYLSRKCAVPAVSAGDVARRIAERESRPPTGANLREISERCIRGYGKDFFMTSLIEWIEQEGWTIALINGIRTPADVATLRERFGSDFYLVHIRVGDAALRFERVRRRGELRDPDEYEEFLEGDRAEEEAFRVSETIKKADLTVGNDSTLEAFHREIDGKIIGRLLKGKAACG
jgi:dephospho-CoA kinase